MSKVKIAIVEDEKIFADLLSYSLNKLGYIPLKPVASYEEAISVIENNKPDIAMLDIQLMGDKDGIDLAWKIKKDYNIPFIFLTSNADKLTIDRVKKLNPPAYLVKPFNEKELYTSIEIALYRHGQEENKKKKSFVIKDALFIKQDNIFKKVKFDEILFIKSDHIYIEINTIDNHKYLVRDSLNEYINKLTKDFIRVQRSYIVNLNYLQAINNKFVIINDNQIPIGKNYREEIMKIVEVG